MSIILLNLLFSRSNVYLHLYFLYSGCKLNDTHVKRADLTSQNSVYRALYRLTTQLPDDWRMESTPQLGGVDDRYPSVQAVYQ